MNCPRCGGANGENSRFCSACGTPLREARLLACPRCGTQNAGDSRFCSYCGMSLSAAVPEREPEKPGRETKAGPPLLLSANIPLEPHWDDITPWLLEAEEAPSWLEEDNQS
ncbi:MAG: zinc ribbon domain-containing protein [Chloroflexi bacterium]|nr:zinc ribbon domain-containing protein [Chloroflexota bacterium]